jgi:hypothetical protein
MGANRSEWERMGVDGSGWVNGLVNKSMGAFGELLGHVIVCL